MWGGRCYDVLPDMLESMAIVVGLDWKRALDSLPDYLRHRFPDMWRGRCYTMLPDILDWMEILLGLDRIKIHSCWILIDLSVGISSLNYPDIYRIFWIMKVFTVYRLGRISGPISYITVLMFYFPKYSFNNPGLYIRYFEFI